MNGRCVQDTPRSRLQQNSARRQGRIVRQRLKYIALTRAQGAVNGRLECRAASDMVLTASMHDHANWWSVGELVQGEVGVNGCLVDPVNMAPSYGPEEGRSNATVHSTPIATAHSISIFAGANRTKMWPQHAGKASLKLEDGSHGLTTQTPRTAREAAKSGEGRVSKERLKYLASCRTRVHLPPTLTCC